MLFNVLNAVITPSLVEEEEDDEEMHQIRTMLTGTPVSVPERPDTTAPSLPINANPSNVTSTPKDGVLSNQPPAIDISIVQPSQEAAEDNAVEAEEADDEDNGDEADGVVEDAPAATEDKVANDDSDTECSQKVESNGDILAASTVKKKGNNYDYILTSYARLSNPPKFCKEEMWYLVYQREVCPKTKREHWQGFVQFIDRKTYKQGTFFLGCGNLSLFSRKGTPAQCRTYCTKIPSRMIGTTYVESGFLQPRTKGVNAFAVYTAAQRANGRSEESLLNDTLCADYMARRKV